MEKRYFLKFGFILLIIYKILIIFTWGENENKNLEIMIIITSFGNILDASFAKNVLPILANLVTLFV